MALRGAFIMPHPPIIIPEIGRGKEEKIHSTVNAYKEAARRISGLSPDTIVVITPHSVMYSDYFHISPGKGAKGNFSQFGAGGLRFEVPYARDFVKSLVRLTKHFNIPAGTLGEKDETLDHGTMVPLYFINNEFKGYNLVRIGLSDMPPAEHYRFGKCIAKAAKESGGDIVLIASGDLSHRLKEEGPYGFAPEGPAFDLEVTEAVKEGNFFRLLELERSFCDAAGECGLRSFWIMAGALDGFNVKPELLSYEGPFGVGYAVAAFEITGERESIGLDKTLEESERIKTEEKRAGEGEYVRLARAGLEEYIKKGRHLSLPDNISKELTEKQAGVFISLKKNGRLRGCIGTIFPTKGNLGEEILENAVLAACRDPRFERVADYELSEVTISVDVLGKPEPVSSEEELDVRRFGVIVSSGNKKGLLLPDIEGVDTVSEQIEIAKQKAGIGKGEKFTISRFEVVRHT